METLYVGEGENHRAQTSRVFHYVFKYNFKRDVFTMEKIIEEEEILKLLEGWNSHKWRKSLIGKLLR